MKLDGKFLVINVKDSHDGVPLHIMKNVDSGRLAIVGIHNKVSHVLWEGTNPRTMQERFYKLTGACVCQGGYDLVDGCCSNTPIGGECLH